MQCWQHISTKSVISPQTNPVFAYANMAYGGYCGGEIEKFQAMIIEALKVTNTLYVTFHHQGGQRLRLWSKMPKMSKMTTNKIG